MKGSSERWKVVVNEEVEYWMMKDSSEWWMVVVNEEG